MSFPEERQAELKHRGTALSGSLWIYHAGLSCCSLEVDAASGPRFDWERLGCRIVDDHRSAEVLLVSGPVPPAMVEELRRMHQEMREPRFVVAAGACASTGGMFGVQDSGVALRGLEAAVPVDLFVPGCPPRPESLIHAILRLQDKLARPLR